MKSVEETLDLLERSHKRARVIAGGTDLIPQLLESAEENKLGLLDIAFIPEIRGVREIEEKEWILVGSATTMAELSESEIITKRGTALAMGASRMGAAQIRSVATIGGNVVNAQPAADTTIPLLALAAEARIVSTKGAKWISLEKLFVNVGESAVNPCEEIVSHFRFRPASESCSSSIQRLANRKVFTLPTLLVAAWVELDDKKQCFKQTRIAAGPVARVPCRLKEAEDSLSGIEVSQVAIEKAAGLAKMTANPRDSIRGGAEYRRDMVEVLVMRALKDCLERLGVPVHE